MNVVEQSGSIQGKWDSDQKQEQQDFQVSHSGINQTNHY
jgi:hypothetical protein